MKNVTEEQLNEVLQKANAETKAALIKLFGIKDERPITERITCWEDVVNELGEDNVFIRQYNHYLNNTPSELYAPELAAYYKLRCVVEALNEGWRPDFLKDYRYYPYFYLYKDEETAKQYKGSNEEIRKMPDSVRCVLWGGDADTGALAGFASAYSYSAPSYADPSIGSRLCFKSRELARYAGRVFFDTYMEYMLL